MLERIVENWLDNATEKTFQIPFCHILQAEGYKVVHLTRHCAMEMGKDIIAVDDEGIPYAYQLKGTKGKRITLNQWRRDVQPQIYDLVYGDISHPSIKTNKSHKSFLVTNGNLDEEVSRSIEDFNRTLREREDNLELNTIVRGELLNKAKELGSDLWPSQLSDIKTFLEIYNLDGNEQLPKEKLSLLFSEILFLSEKNYDTNPSKTKCVRNISSCALLCSACISSFSNSNNYVAEIEAWTLFIAHVFACAERWDLEFKKIKDTIDIALETIYNNLSLLCEELMERDHYVEGDVLTDKKVYGIRMTLLISLMSFYGLWRKYKEEEKNEHDEFIEKFCDEKEDQLSLWGEAAVPQFLTLYWYSKTIDATQKPNHMIANLIKSISQTNSPESQNALPNPYYDINDIFSDSNIKDNFAGGSYTIESLVYLFVRLNLKQKMRFLWPDITRLCFYSFEAEELWQYYLWRAKKGTNINDFPPLTKKWDELKEEAYENAGEKVPNFLKENVIFSTLFLVVYPHRCYPNLVRWLDSKHRRIRKEL